MKFAFGVEIWFQAGYINIMTKFDYNAPAELFLSRSRAASRGRMKYRRFSTGAEALRFAIEELPAVILPGTILEADESRFSHTHIRELYDSPKYPLKRRARG